MVLLRDLIGDVNPSKIEKLDLSYRNLKEFPTEIEQLVNLRELNISYNQLTSLPAEIGKLFNLRELNISFNQLTSLPAEIGQLINLQVLYIDVNKLTSLPAEIGQLINLQWLSISYNQLTSLPAEIGQLTNLRELNIYDNQLTSLPAEIGQLINLLQLDINHNQLTSLPAEIGQLINLQVLNISNNKLTSLPAEIGQLVNLEVLIIFNNPIDFIPPQVQRLINRLNHGQGIYQDQQSVHNSGIQESFRKTVNRLSQKKPNQFNLLEEILASELKQETKTSLVEYSENKDVHFHLQLTFEEILTFVWNRIRVHPDRLEIMKVLDSEMQDALCMCPTGRITRLVNSLNGFDPDVQLTISDNEQLSNLVIMTKNKIVPYDLIKHRELLHKEMEERKYSEEVIQEWLSYLE